MSLLPSTIGPIAERNMPGACKLMLVAADDIVTFPDEVNGTVQAIAIADDAVWMEVNGTRWTQVFSDTWTLVDGKQLSRALCMLELPKDRPALLAGLWKLKHRRHVVLHFDMNGTIKVMGTKEEPATVRLVSLEHGGDPRNSANRMGLQVEVVRGSACPFYLATPPTPATPGSCPTVAEQIAPLSWSAIEALLDEDQLAAAEAALSSSLCEMLDEALVGTPANSFTTTGAGASEYNLSWTLDGIQNGKDSYTNGTFLTAWSGTAWVMIDEAVGTEFYQSTDDTEFPWEATGWTAQFGIDTPVPTLTQDGGIDATAVTDCLSPEQRAAVLAALSE